MFNFATALVFVSAVSAIPSPKIVQKDVTTVLDNLETIDAQTNTLTTDINDWDGSLLGALGISGDATTLETDITSANDEAETESQADDADTTTILDYVTGTLGPDIITALDALVAQEPGFDALGLDSTVLSIIQTLQNDTDALAATLIEISATDQQAAASSAVSSIDAAFATAEAAFDS